MERSGRIGEVQDSIRLTKSYNLRITCRILIRIVITTDGSIGNDHDVRVHIQSRFVFIVRSESNHSPWGFPSRCFSRFDTSAAP